MSIRQFLCTAAIVLATDQATKWLALTRLPRWGSVPIIPGLVQLTLTSNTGAAFGLFRSATPALAIIALVAALGICIYFVRRRRGIGFWTGMALALAMGGSCGNFADRAFRKYVIDFLDVYIGRRHWPIFNVADASICVGIGLLTIMLLFGRDDATPNRDHPPVEHSSAVSE